MKRENEVTYVAPGMLEWHMCVKVGKATVRIRFSGGYMGTNGLVAARFITGDRALQKIIEESVQYESGRVRRLRSFGER